MGNDLLDRNSDFRLGTFNAHLLRRVRASDTADRAMRWLSVLTTGHRLLPHYALFLPRLLTFKVQHINCTTLVTNETNLNESFAYSGTFHLPFVAILV